MEEGGPAGCCPHEPGPGPGGGGGEGGLEPVDVPLAACCERDLKMQREGARMRAALRAVDRAMQRQDLREATVLAERLPQGRAPAEESAGGSSSDESSLEGSDGEGGDDGFLLALRERRLEELRAQGGGPEQLVPQKAAAAVPARVVRRRGYADMQERRVLRESRRPGFMVAHLAVPGHSASAEADELLADLADAHPKTRFVRVALEGGHGAGLAQSLCVPDLPAMVTFRSGDVVGNASYAMLGKDGEVHEELLRRHLEQVGAIQRRPAGSGSESSEEEGDEPLVAPCVVCGRTYPHTHVRSSRAGWLDATADGSSSSDEA